MTINKRIRILGEVQGVLFRKSTLEKARQLSINGWVKNESDGSVLAEIEGTSQAVSMMEDWLRVGPKDARVSEIIVEEGKEKGYRDFEIIR
ncbi:MAG TPA: acylphosphatase [Cyclobacteriaceae bacterium]|nr:acylphosphatase [Cyclobacteriaceae bacterium]